MSDYLTRRSKWMSYLESMREQYEKPPKRSILGKIREFPIPERDVVNYFKLNGFDLDKARADLRGAEPHKMLLLELLIYEFKEDAIIQKDKDIDEVVLSEDNSWGWT